MGALALPPGPWLERAARNGLFGYTDACNLHFYGHANDLAGVIRAHEAFAAKWADLPSRTVVMPADAAFSPQVSGLRSEPSSSSPQVSGFRSQASGLRSQASGLRSPASGPSPQVSGFSFQPSAFPLWITECGLNAVAPGDFLNPERRQLQAEFAVAAARQALAAGSVAVFMPFILVDRGDPYAMTLAPDRPLPAWTAYAGFTRRHPFPARVLAMPPRDPNPVVVQWLPDNRTTIPHKVSGTYRFIGAQPIRGVLRIYNFGDEAVAGRLEAPALSHVSLVGATESPAPRQARGPELVERASRLLHLASPRMAKGNGAATPPSRMLENGWQRAAGGRCLCSPELTVPAMGRVDIPVTFTADGAGYFRESWSAEFVDNHGRRSPVCFGLEAMPREEDFAIVPIRLGPPEHAGIGHPMFDEFTLTSASGAWTGINSLMIEEGEAEKLKPETLKSETGEEGAEKLKAETLKPETGEGGAEKLKPERLKPERLKPETGDLKAEKLKAWVTRVENDPLRPTMAVARVKDLPPRGFLRLQLDQPMDPDFKVRVDLVDRRGQRFTVWENFGAGYFGARDDVWLSLEDFHVYFWGRCSDQPGFRPQDVEEIQLRFYFARANEPRTMRLTLLEPR